MKKIKLSKKQHRLVFNQNRSIFATCEYFLNENGFVTARMNHNFAGKVVNTLLFPLHLLFEGLGNLDMCWNDVKNGWTNSMTITLTRRLPKGIIYEVLKDE